MIPHKVKRHTVPHWKAFKYGKNEARGLSCGKTLSICQYVLKSGNLLHKWDFVDFQWVITVLYALQYVLSIKKVARYWDNFCKVRFF